MVGMHTEDIHDLIEQLAVLRGDANPCSELVWAGAKMQDYRAKFYGLGSRSEDEENFLHRMG
jgi:hypothetical protein